MRIGTGTVSALRLGSTAVSAAYLGTTQVFGNLLSSVISQLFSASEPGFFYAVSPSVCFTDTARTTPATIGDAVAGMTDLSGRGAHATQATVANRPILGRKPQGGRRNLRTFTEQFDNAVWSKLGTTVSANTEAAPNGAFTADTLTENTAFSAHQVRLVNLNLNADTYTFSVYVKPNGRNRVALNLETSGFINYTYVFDIASGSLIGFIQNAPLSQSITDAGNGWYRISITSNQQIKDAGVALVPSGTTTIYTGDGTSGIFIWGAQLELNSTATAYQRVASTFDVTESGKPDQHYLFFGGAANPRWMTTPTITPGTDKVQVFAGVRKLSDAAVGIIAETSANAASNNGAFWLLAPADSGAANYGFAHRGGASIREAKPASGFSAPITNVLSGISDIAIPAVQIRVNGAQAAQNTSATGTGNFLAYSAFIGARAGTSIYLNGEISALIVRFGPNLTTQQIELVEGYVAAQLAEATI